MHSGGEKSREWIEWTLYMSKHDAQKTAIFWQQ